MHSDPRTERVRKGGWWLEMAGAFILLFLSLKGTWVLVWKVFFGGLSVLGGWVRQGG